MEEQFYLNLKEKAKKFFEAEDDGHGFDHVERVFNNAMTICKDEKVDIDVVKTAALLHDIARQKEREGKVKEHTEEGAKMAKKILGETNFSKEKIKDVCYAIRVHRFSKGINPETKEAAILQDADRLDALGAIILVRMLKKAVIDGHPIYDADIPPKEKYDGTGSTVINHLYEKILKIKPETFHTSKAKELAKGRYEFVSNFAERYLNEIKGVQ